MDLLELEAVLGLNTSEYEKGINGALNMFGGLKDLVGKGITLAVNVAWDFTKDVFETGLEFDKAMSGVYAVTQASDEGVQSLLKNAAVAEAQMSAFTTAEVAMAEYYEGLAGYDTTEITEGLHGIVVTAEAAGESLPRIADILTDTVRAFGDGAEQQEHYGDVLAATATSTNTTITKMGDALKYVAPLAGALGYSVEDVAISLGVMADRGTKAGQAGTTLRNIFTRIATNAGATQKDVGALDVLVEKLGVDFYDSEKNARPWIDVIEDCRKAWQGLNDVDRDTVLDGFAQVAVGGKDADEVLKNLTKSADEANAMLNNLQSTKDADEQERYADSIRGIASSYSLLFDLLGMNVDPANDDIKTLTDALEQARIKLSGLTDEEQIYFSKQIGSMRGMTGWLELMNATDESFNNVKESIYGAKGAADEMANLRRGSTLYGDIQQFNSALDALKTNIYNVYNGPLRPLVQWATDALRDINNAIGENGLQGGIDMLSTKIEELTNNESFKTVLTDAGKLAGIIINGFLDAVLPNLIEAARTAAGSFLEKLGEELRGGQNLFSIIAGNFIGGLFSKDISNGRTLDLAELLGAGQITAEIVPTLKSSSIQEAIDAAVAEGQTTVTIDGFEFSTDEPAAEIAKQLGYIGLDAAETIKTSVKDGSVDGITVGEQYITQTMHTTGATVSNDFETQIGNAGIPAGQALGNNIQSMLNSRSFVVDIMANIIGLPGGATIRQNASAMNPGRIFNRPTIFGYADGAYQVAGDAGPEAVVGTNSLQRMIQDAVYSAVGPQTFSVPRNTDRPINIVFELNGAQKWVYRLNKLEEQRVGVKLGGGVM